MRDKDWSIEMPNPIDYEPGPIKDDASLTELADHYKSDKGNIKHLYTPIYEKFLVQLKDSPIDLLEIGVACGCSLKMWHSYFQKATITGMDNREECSSLCKKYKRVKIAIGDARDFSFNGMYDVIIDDGSHISLDIVRIFNNLWPRLRSGGLYFIEDVCCTHRPPYITNFPHRDSADFDRQHFIGMLDNLMIKMDDNDSDVEFFHQEQQLIVLKKK